MKSLVAMIFASMLSVSASAASESCAQLKQEFKAMHKAQQAIMTSLVNNHETFASTLEEYSLKPASKPMQKSAEAFRRRGVQSKKMASQLNLATADLIVRMSKCL